MGWLRSRLQRRTTEHWNGIGFAHVKVGCPHFLSPYGISTLPTVFFLCNCFAQCALA